MDKKPYESPEIIASGDVVQDTKAGPGTLEVGEGNAEVPGSLGFHL